MWLAMRYILFLKIFVFCMSCFAQTVSTNTHISEINADQKTEGFEKLTKIDSLYLSLRNSKEDTSKVNLLNALSWELMYAGNTTAAKELANEAISLAEKMKYKKGCLGAYNSLANVYVHNGDHPEALKKYFETLKLSEEMNYKRGIANAYNNIGSVYSNTRNYKEALANYQAALKVKLSPNDKKITAISYENIGIINQIQGDIDEALKNHQAALKLREEMGDKRAVGWSYQNLAIDYASKKEYERSSEYFEKALSIQEAVGDKFEMCRIYGNMGELYIERKKYKEALSYCERGLALAKELKFIEMVYQMEKVISEIHELTGNTALALEHYKKYKVVKDSAQNVEMQEKIVRAEMNYKFEKQKQKEELLQSKKEALINEELRYQRILAWLGIVGVVLTGIIAVILLNGYRRKIRTNELLAQQKEEISRQKAGIEGQEEERKRISKELHDGLGGTLAGIKLNLERIDNMSEGHANELRKIIANVGDACKEVRSISHDLTPVSISNSSLSEVIHDLAEKFNDPNHRRIQFDCFPEQEVNEVFDGVKTEVYRIVQECLNNIVKHSGATEVHIGLLKEDDELHVLIEDNGKGFDVKRVNKGIGIKNIEERIKLLSGTIAIDSKLGRGTAINLRVKA